MKNTDIIQHYLDGTRPYAKVGYTGDKNKYIIRKLGETWSDSAGREWIQKESGPQTVNRVMDIVRAEMNEKCTCCKREIRWGSRLDRKMFFKTKKCLDCTIEEETQLKLKGKFKLYETKKLLENELAYLDEIRQKLKESKDYLESEDSKTLTWANSTGMVEVWSNEARCELLENAKKDFVTCLKKIKSAKKELEKVNAEISKVLTPI